jgi:predicted phage baseplate assembly protein
MPLPKPALDNRVYDQLVAEGRAQIPRLAPRWTDHNASDPGITLLELAAWLSEQNIYRFDRPSDEALRGFARLVLNGEASAAGVGTTVVAVRNPNPQPVELPARIQLASDAAELFETKTALHASPARLLQLGPGHASHTKFADMTALNDARSGWTPFGARPRPGAALYFAFDRALDAPGATLSLHVWTDTWLQDPATALALRAEYDALVEHLAAVCPPCPWKDAAAEADWRRHYRVGTIWEYDAGGAWKPLADVVDETRALTLSGFVRFSAPAGHQPNNGRWLIRCRIRRGRYECAPRVLHVAVNAVASEHALSRSEKSLGKARGTAHAMFALDDAPIVHGTTQIRVDDGAGDVQTDWTAVTEWDRCGPHDRCIRLDAALGALQSGDGLRGAVLPADYEVLAAYRVGGGVAGNIAAETLTRVPPNAINDALTQPQPLSALAAALTVWQPFAAAGGKPRESLRAMQARAWLHATRVDKAVTLADFERLALETPGVPVARVRAVAGAHPTLPCYPAPGIVQLIVVPRCRLPAPLPSRALLDSVERYLEPRRLVTSELHARPPRYRRVSVHATLHIDCLVHDAASLVQRAVERVNEFMDPLTGGPDGGGWPIGRTVYRNELIALLTSIDGVARVTDFGLNGPCGEGACCDNVVLCADELPRPGRHRLQARFALPANLRRSDAHECEPEQPCT